MNRPSVSRRGVLGASLAATAAAVPAVASSCPAPGPGPDALLMDVLARYWQAERAILAMEAVPEPSLTAPEYPAWESKFDALIASRAQAIGQMADIRAMTPEDRRSKAQIVERCLPSSVRWGDGGLDTPEIRLALSLARDVNV
ncbi:MULTISPECIES: twin-arginine translocation signal domain-containing protein [Acetobacter]|uniref:Uncharacterized protein n=1 Tax=Acetobacter pomorum DM001 TaxID=945681 RepID=F1YRW3_9PROT|nr:MULTISPECIES: twin-arginine translocation signal domain-containing protein [Acetobacter]AXC27557.1 hypothetical protein DS739_12950 [Acetobacter sp. JWB]EGE48553.1 Hypothetical protein APO_0650 [Acetobacter pomorum DM001]KAA8423950.1 twin-arginine translocation signal domain-containing protein [Acetobacter pomorum]KAA8438347.1 twin-arginine translocation signal domain-containing protein [Acetobacter pomorum]KAA8452904.1 twin-arginine translocation signal domain-containing protein [Acetobact